MDKSKLITKVACLIGYLLFAGFSAYFTASSLSLNLLNGTKLWLIFILVLVIAILAGWCLSNVIEESQKTFNASKVKFVFNLLGFLIFWAFSFLTNVHYFFVEKHGYNILAEELSSAKNYIVENTDNTNKKIDEAKNLAKSAMQATVRTNIDDFARELRDTRAHHSGFGDACISILNGTEVILAQDKELYNDQNQYVIFDDVKDAGDKGVTQYNRFSGLQAKYQNRMVEQLNKKLDVIDNYYETQKDQNTELLDLLPIIEDLEILHLPVVLKDGSINAYYKYYEQQDGRVIAKMPKEYKESCVVRDDDAKIEKYTPYPSGRMFDTMSVWGDIFKGRLGDMTMIQWVIIALIFDIVAFILFYLFRK